KVTSAPHEPVDLLIARPPDDVLADAVATIDAQFLVQVDTRTGRRHLADEFGSAFDVVVVGDACLAAALRLDEQQRIRLRLVRQLKSRRTIVAAVDAGGRSLVDREDTSQMTVGPTVSAVTDRGWHVNDSFD